MKIGIYGGTFNPPHRGHLVAAKLAMEKLGLDHLIFIPVGTPPHKPLPENTPRDEQRLDMVMIAVDTIDQYGAISTDAMELRRSGESYTVETLALLREKYSHDELWLLMGSDMLLSFSEWREPEKICKLANLAAFVRSETDDRQAMAEQAGRLAQNYGATVRLLNLEEIVDISSTRLRALLEKGEGSQYLSPAVYGYILRNGLYGTHADLTRLTDDQLRACSLSMVYAKRHRHILGVEQEAVKLAEHWGADPELARRAGILHDCTKYLPLEEHLAICAKAGIELDELERQSEKLLHSKSGAAIARRIYGQPEEVYWAIYWHTTGRADMTLLEKIIYLADYMEPNRDFPGVEELRRLCYTDLDAALEMGLAMSVDDLKERGVPIHKNTQGALDYILERRKG